MKVSGKKFYLFGLLLFSSICFASNNLFLNLPSRTSISVNSGNNTFGEAEALLPIWGNADQSFFADVAGKYGDDSAWFLSGGIGGREIFDDALLGAYLFDDANKTTHANYFNVINPGIEVMTNEWDGHLNGYFPIGQKNRLITTYTGTQLGMSNTSFFSGHTQYDTIFDLLEEVGPGTDVQVGRTFSSLNRMRVFAGGYYFNPKNTTNMNGLEAGIEMPLTFQWATAEVRDTYDNINHNTFIFTLRFNFGGLDKTAAPNIHDRMDDWIPRHIATLQTGDGIPTQNHLEATAGTMVIRNNIWFFNPNAPIVLLGANSLGASQITLQSCTFEHPCIGIQQSQIDQINNLAPNANFYLSSGTYNNPAVGSGFTFHNGQNIFGRTSNFQQLATGNNRPLLNDSMLLEGNNNIYNMRVNGQSVVNVNTFENFPFQVGILDKINSTGTVNIYTTDASVSSSVNNVIAIVNNSDSSTLNIYNSLAASAITTDGGSAVGIGNFSNSALNLYNSSIASSATNASNDGAQVFGFFNNKSGVVNIVNSTISANLVHGNVVSGVINNNLIDSNPGIITITNSMINVNADDSFFSLAVDNEAVNLAGISGNININNSTINITGNNNVVALTAGVTTSGTGAVSINNSTINAAANAGSLFGIFVTQPAATANFQNTHINIDPTGGAIGTPTLNVGTLNDNGGNVCTSNGIPVPCV